MGFLNFLKKNKYNHDLYKNVDFNNLFHEEPETYNSADFGKFTDKNGKYINIGDPAVVTDVYGKKWYGEIVIMNIPTIHTFENGDKYANYMAFYSNYNITLWQYWTELKLEVLENK